MHIRSHKEYEEVVFASSMQPHKRPSEEAAISSRGPCWVFVLAWAMCR